MLSKLRHATSAASIWCPHIGKEIEHGLRTHYGDALRNLHALPGGTLSFCFAGEINGKQRFFKTHAWNEGGTTLRREAYFLNCTSPNETAPQLLALPEGDRTRIWLQTDLLRPNPALNPAQAFRLVGSLNDRLRSCNAAAIVPAADHIGLLLSEAGKSLDVLRARGLVSSAIGHHTRAGLDRLEKQCDQWPRQLCHGDLGPANILGGPAGPVALDWEDAFWGIQGYDYLYWLTFFSNRKWLLREFLGHTGLGVNTEIDLMTMIIVLKSMLSTYNGSNRRDTLTFDQRLGEVFALA